jgi:tetratricopeptide (TPR) repeat protein
LKGNAQPDQSAQDKRKLENELKARQEVDKAVAEVAERAKTRETDPAGYINALVSLAYRYKAINQVEKADEAFDQAINVYAKQPSDMSRNNLRTICNYLRSVPPDRFESLILKIMQISEKGDELGDRDRCIAEAINQHSYQRRDAQQEKRLWQKAIDIRTALRGSKDSSLELLLRCHSSACEQINELGEAERDLLRANALSKSPDSSVKPIFQLQLCEFYLRHKMFKQAEAAWREAEHQESGGISQGAARYYVNVIGAYKNAERYSDAENVLNSLLTIGGDHVVEELDPTVEDFLQKYLTSGNQAKAQALLEKRVRASATCYEDNSASMWRIKLSDYYLTIGRKADSDRLFQSVLSTTALQGISTESMRQRRADLIASLASKTTGNVAGTQKTAVAPTQPIRLMFGLLAMQELRFGHNANVSSYDSSTNPRAMPALGTRNARVCCVGAVRRDGNLMLNGTVYGNLAPDVSFGPFGVRAPLPAGVTPFQAALRPPASSSPNSQTQGPFDYVSSHVERLTQILMPGKRPLRIFLTDTSMEPFAFDAMGINEKKPSDLQIWYDGIRKLRVQNMTGVVYAPNATVIIPFNSTFNGAIVANRIITEGNNNIMLDDALLNMQFR